MNAAPTRGRRRLLAALTVLAIATASCAALIEEGAGSIGDAADPPAEDPPAPAPEDPAEPPAEDPADPAPDNGSEPPPPPDTQQPPAPAEQLRFIFSSTRSGNLELWSIDENGADPVQLTSDPAYQSWWARVAPDGERLLLYRTPAAFRANDYQRTELWVMNVDGTGLRRLRAAGQDGWLSQGHAEWSPDGRRMVMAGMLPDMSWHLFVTDHEGANPVEVQTDSLSPIDPSWSSDGTEIVFSAVPPDDTGLPVIYDYEIHVIGVDGTGERRITYDGLRDHDPYMSPDGETIVWITEVVPFYVLLGKWALRAAPSDGTGVSQLTSGESVDSVPQWIDETSFVFFRWEFNAPGAGLYTLRLGEAQPIPLIDAAEPTHDENPTPFAVPGS
ncbi:MAG: Protein TolB [Acidimicrobiales bacterium]|nr:MAG: hypothetical protein EDR02_09185 [Actinomycetota bacterium]MBV6509577.1 Protein TolB [Acidimicrobiales bacterium]RIK06561.1 MAG: hypothetical protein DCC48_06510 [Acidobacteriota bacterium]